MTAPASMPSMRIGIWRALAGNDLHLDPASATSEGHIDRKQGRVEVVWAKAKTLGQPGRVEPDANSSAADSSRFDRRGTVSDTAIANALCEICGGCAGIHRSCQRGVAQHRMTLGNILKMICDGRCHSTLECRRRQARIGISEIDLVCPTTRLELLEERLFVETGRQLAITSRRANPGSLPEEKSRWEALGERLESDKSFARQKSFMVLNDVLFQYITR